MFRWYHPEFRSEGVWAPDQFTGDHLLALARAFGLPAAAGTSVVAFCQHFDAVEPSLPTQLRQYDDRRNKWVWRVPEPPLLSSAGAGAGAGASSAAVSPAAAVTPRTPSTPLRYTKYSQTQPHGGAMYVAMDYQVNAQIRAVYKDGIVTTPSGVTKKLQAAVNPVEGKHLYDVVRMNGFRRTLEVGCANGLSAMYLAQAVQDNGGGTHTSIDPFQSTQWQDVGQFNVTKAGLGDLHSVIQEKSHVALPRLLAEGKRYNGACGCAPPPCSVTTHTLTDSPPPWFAAIFIDGMHLYDFTLVDFFYSALLLEVGGVILLDDVKHPAVLDCMRYLKSNYPHFKLLTDTPCHRTLATFVKVADDSRSWDFHKRM